MITPPPTQISTWAGVEAGGCEKGMDGTSSRTQLFERHPDADDACWSDSRVLVVVVRPGVLIPALWLSDQSTFPYPFSLSASTNTALTLHVSRDMPRL